MAHSAEVVGALVGENTDYAHDANGNVILVTDPLSNVTASAFDPLDRLVTVTDALTNTAGYGYVPGSGMYYCIIDRVTH